MTDIPEKPPFGPPVIWGKRGAGKTIAMLNSPWQPVHVIDVENSSGDYFMHQKRLIEMNFLTSEFTRASCFTFEAFNQEYLRITGQAVKDGKVVKVNDGLHFGTIGIDTAGQIATWVANSRFAAVSPAKAEKLSGVVWGDIRDRLRNMFLSLQEHCDLIILTAHEREFPKGVFSPRINPGVLELTSYSIRLLRGPNQKMPDADFTYNRLPFFPPKVPGFTITKMLDYIQHPADWDNLKDEEKHVPAPVEEDQPDQNLEDEILDKA